MKPAFVSALAAALLALSAADSSESIKSISNTNQSDGLTVIPPTHYSEHLRATRESSASARSARKSGYHEGYDIIVSCGIDHEASNLYGANGKQVSTSNLGRVNCYILCDWFINDCEAATWSSYNGGTCWFKSVITPYLSTPKEGTATSYFAPKDPSVPDTHLAVYPFRNCDMEGNDIGNERRASASGCVFSCNANKNCWAWTWTDYNGGTCWFKSQARACVVKSGVQSGYHFKRAQNAGSCMGLPSTGIN
jgi:hypothetical protein